MSQDVIDHSPPLDSGPAIARGLLASRAAGAAVALPATLLLLSLLYQPTGWMPIAIIAALVATSAIAPLAGLLWTVALAPIATVLFALTRSQDWTLRFDEALVLAFLAGWGAHRFVRPRPLQVSPEVRWSAALLLFLAAASAALTIMIVGAEHPDAGLVRLVGSVIVRDYLITMTPLAAALLFVEGVLLVLVVCDTCSDESRRFAAVRMLVLGCTAAAALNLLRIVTAAFAQEHSWSAFLGYFARLRVNIHHGDWNAAGSYFAMVLVVAAALAVRARAYTAAVPIIAAAVWMSGSRFALAACLATATGLGIIALVARSRRRVVSILVLLAIAGGLVGAAWKWYPSGRNARTDIAFSIRFEMANAGLQMTAERPWFGVGLGWFQPRSVQYSSMRENSHNNYIQVMAELGILGLIAFLATVAFALRETWRRTGQSEPRWGLLGGIATLLMTSVGGHPLIVHGSAYAFWTTLGLASVPGDRRAAPSRTWRTAIVAMLVVLVAAFPFRAVEALRGADREQASVGYSPHWQREPDGLRYRWAGARSAFFVPAAARAVRVPLRLPTGTSPIQVRFLADGREIDGALLRPGDDWRTVRLLLKPGAARFTRIDLVATSEDGTTLVTEPTDAGGALMVGRPMVEQ